MKTSILAGIFLSFGVLDASAQGNLEIPDTARTETGIVAISGWHCTAQRVDILIDNLSALRAGGGTERGDTGPVCGRVDTGFSLLFNFNRLGVGPHTIVALADGVEFARHDFNVYHFGTEFMTGVTARRALRNFPAINRTTRVEWMEEKQNFSMTGREPTPSNPGLQGLYYGAIGTSCLTDIGGDTAFNDVRLATFDVQPSRDFTTLTVNIRYADGAQCSMTGAATLSDNGYLVAPSPTSTCQLGDQQLSIAVDGVRLKGRIGTVSSSDCFHERVFYGARPAWYE
jgi:hypothetical protein